MKSAFKRAYRSTGAALPNYGASEGMTERVWWDTMIRSTLDEVRPCPSAFPRHIPLICHCFSHCISSTSLHRDPNCLSHCISHESPLYLPSSPLISGGVHRRARRRLSSCLPAHLLCIRQCRRACNLNESSSLLICPDLPLSPFLSPLTSLDLPLPPLTSPLTSPDLP